MENIIDFKTLYSCLKRLFVKQMTKKFLVKTNVQHLSGWLKNHNTSTRLENMILGEHQATFGGLYQTQEQNISELLQIKLFPLKSLL